MTGREFSEADTRKALECCCLQHNCEDCPYNRGVFEGCMIHLLSDAYDIINKMIGVEDETMNNSTPLPINWANTVPHGTCPSCGAIVMQYIDSPKPNYCFNCGLKLIIERKNKNLNS